MKLEISQTEKEMLVMVLEHYIPELRAEIASGVKHDWKVTLHKEKDVLRVILDRLKDLN